MLNSCIQITERATAALSSIWITASILNMVLVGSSLDSADAECKLYNVVTATVLFSAEFIVFCLEVGGGSSWSLNIFMSVMSQVASGCQGKPAAGYQASSRFQLCQSAREAKEKWRGRGVPETCKSQGTDRLRWQRAILRNGLSWRQKSCSLLSQPLRLQLQTRLLFTLFSGLTLGHGYG